jgi:hypothetical protein
LQQYQQAIAEHVERLRARIFQANDPEVIHQFAAQDLARQAIDNMAFVQALPDPRDPRLIVRPRHKNQYGELAKATEVLLPEASGTLGVLTDPKFPHNAPRWSFTKDTRKG